jgi:hypothetical protein
MFISHFSGGNTMKRLILGLILLAAAAPAFSATLTYTAMERVSLRDLGLPADERSTNILIPAGNVVYGATSGDRCHIFRFDPSAKKLADLAVLDGPNTVLKGMVRDGSTLYVGTMLTRRQLWWEGHRRGGKLEEIDATMYPIDKSWKTGHLYRITGADGSSPKIDDLGVPVEGQGIHTLAMDTNRGLIYGITYPAGRFFIFDTKTGKTEAVTFGNTTSYVSNHMVGAVEVVKDLTDFSLGEAETYGKLVARAMHVMPDGVLYTSGWEGQIVKYDPKVEKPRDRFTVVANIPSVPDRRFWNRLDEIVEHGGKLYLGTSDGYILRFDPATNEIENFGKPIRAIEVMGMAFSPLDGKLYGINGGDEEGLSRFWCMDTANGTFDVDYAPVKVFNRKPMADVVSLDDGTIVMAETERVADLWVLTAKPKKEPPKAAVAPPAPPSKPSAPPSLDHPEYFTGHKKLEMEVFPIPSTMHGGSGYTAIQADDAGRIYVGGAYYGKFAPLMQLDPKTSQWRLLFRSDELSHQYARGVGAPGKIHTKLRLGDDGKIYGAMKQGYEFQFDIRPDMGESPEGKRGGYLPSHFFSYDPKTDRTEDLGPGFKQDGTVGFCADTKRGFLYGMTEPSAYFEVYDLNTKRMWIAGPVFGDSSNRYMVIDKTTGRVYHKGEITPSGKYYMSVWDPADFRLRDVEIAADEGLVYSHSYAITNGPVGSHTLYGSAENKLVEMNLVPGSDGRLHVRPVCTLGVEGETHAGYLYSIETGPDGRIYWACNYGDHGLVPMAFFAWDPKTKTKTYLGTAALGGQWLGGMTQGIAFDKQGNMAVHILYAKMTPEQFKISSRSKDFHYTDIESQPYYLGYPQHYEGTWYSVFYVKNATKIR